MSAQDHGEDEIHAHTTTRLHSAPKGLLRYYILHKVAERPIHGYEVIQAIDSKTEGGWRPGAGSLYPIMKKLVSEGLIRSEAGSTAEATRRVYHITPKGVKNLEGAKEMFMNFQQRWNMLRGVFIDLVEPENLARFFVDGSKRQFQLAQEMFEAKADRIPGGDAELVLKEYILNLERQLGWATRKLDQLKPKLVHVAGVRRRGKA